MRLSRPVVLGVIALGGMLGASARYGVSRALPTATGHFPWATLWVNLAGSFALGLFLTVALQRGRVAMYLRSFVATGLLGGFTTFSTFAVDGDLLIRDHHTATAVIYVALTLALALPCAVLGVALGRRIAA